VSHLKLVGLVGIVVLLLAPLGLAATATADPGSPGLNQASSAVYPNENTSQVLGTGGQGGDPGDPGGSAIGDPGGSSLPFTGFYAPALLAVGLLMLAGGLGMRRIRLTRPPAQS
jgi:hypothetical protein